MTNHTNILVENFKESLKGAQAYLVVGNGTALFLLILAMQGNFVDVDSVSKLVIPFIGLTAPSYLAFSVALALYVISGLVAHSYLTHNQRIRKRLADADPTLLDVVTTYPSLLTSSCAVKIGFALLPAILISLALLILNISQASFGFILGDIVIFASPYLSLAWRVWSITASQSSDSTNSI